VSTISSGGGSIQVGGKGAFRPIDKLPVEYGEVPDEGEMIQIPTSPTAATAVMEILDLVAAATDWSILVQPGVKDKSIWFFSSSGMRPKQILDVLKYNGIVYDFDEESRFLYVMTSDEFRSGKYGKIVKADMQVRYVDVSEMQTTLQTLASDNAKLISDPRTGRIVVYDTQSNIDEMKAMVKRLDVPVEPRTYGLRFINADQILESIEPMLSERGSATADLRMNTIIVTDLATRQDQIAAVIGEMDRKLETRSWEIKYLDIEEVESRLENVIPEEMGVISIDETTHRVSVQATAERLEQVDELIAQWDVKPRQVQIEAYLVTLNSTLSRNLDVNWNYFANVNGQPFSLQHGTVPKSFTDSTAKKGLRVGEFPYATKDVYPFTSTPRLDLNRQPIVDAFGGNKLAMFLDYLDETKDARILARPRVTVRDGEEAKFENTEEKPYQEAGYSSYGGSYVNPTSTYQNVIPLQVKFLEVGTVLEVTPTINSEDNVLLDIRAESSTPTTPVGTITGSGQLFGKLKSQSTTTVMVKDGHTIIIGGLMYSQVDDTEERVPVLGEIPLIGRAFKNTDKTRGQNELLIFITPTIVNEYTMPETDRLARAEAYMGDKNREARKGLAERVQGVVTRHRGEVRLAVGREGNYFADGEPVLREELELFLAEAASKGARKVVVSRDPRAPKAAIDVIRAGAEKAGVKFVLDAKALPFVPRAAFPAVSDGSAQDALAPLPVLDEKAGGADGADVSGSGEVEDDGVAAAPDEAEPAGTR
ncbi:MAG TPA: secretin N-terminal domain-containing protein, partial [Candidatus Hydrogenedentes bacterium]|nr:secretin N-terminal domain-containing protein [Candidatus Hydrogenedentota bacterium]